MIASMSSPPPSPNREKPHIHSNGANPLHSNDNSASKPAEELRLVLKNPDRPANLDLDIEEEDLRPVIDDSERPANYDYNFE